MAYRESVVVTLTSCYSPEKFTRGKNWVFFHNTTVFFSELTHLFLKNYLQINIIWMQLEMLEFYMHNSHGHKDLSLSFFPSPLFHFVHQFYI
jgi:hypothetical protein